nr:uncharacterized hypothetical protein conserved in bacteria [uncultured bacterium]
MLHKKIFSFISILLIVSVPAGYCENIDTRDRTEQIEMLKKIQRDTFQYFIDQQNPKTGLIKDSSRNASPASIAATGFGLASIAIGAAHGWISYKDAHTRIQKTLETLKSNDTHRNGFFYHFLDPETGKRSWNSEVSSIDTALLAAGMLLASTYFSGTSIEKRSREIYERINWPWMLNGTDKFCHGWSPKTGFLPYYWDMYAEHLILLALAIGSSSKPAPVSVWSGWERNSDTYKHKQIIYSYTGSLFTYQYSHAFIDFKILSDHGVNFSDNSLKATLANYQYSKSFASEYKSYELAWGLSASLGPDGYRAYGALPGEGMHDGTIAPYAALSAIILTPQKSTAAAEYFYTELRNKLYGRYGFRGAYNLDRNWWADEYLGIDEGIIVLMLENYLNHGAVWKRFMNLQAIKKWIDKTNLTQKAA